MAHSNKDDIFSRLPDPILAHIISFTITSTKDLAHIRFVSKKICNDIVPLIPTSLNTKITQCCFQNYEDSFVSGLLELDCFEYYEVVPGDTWKFSEKSETSDYDVHVSIFPEGSVQSILFLDDQKHVDESGFKKNKHQVDSEDALEYDMRKICTGLLNSKSMKELESWRDLALKLDGFLPYSSPGDECDSTTKTRLSRQHSCYSTHVLLSMTFPDFFMKKMERKTNNIISMQSRCKLMDDSSINAHNFITAHMDDHGKYFDGYVQDDGTVLVPMRIISPDFIWDEFYVNSITSLRLMEFNNNHFDQNIKEGVAIVDGIVSDSLRSRLNNEINDLAQNSSVDYHPHSKNVVRDLVHPALYPYVKGITQLVNDASSTPPCFFLKSQPLNMNYETKCDFWGRKYEDSKYQWLPTYFKILADGSCHIQDYINNLVPRTKYSNLYHILAELFQQALPFFEVVYSYVRNVRPLISTETHGEDEGPYDRFALDQNEFTSLKNQELQIITKIVDYELSSQSQMNYEGVWHVEGMSHEEIVATGLYILDRDEDIEGGSIIFQRSFHKDECDEIFEMVPQDRHLLLDETIENGLSPLGMIETLRGRLIVFPNSHVHKVSTMKKVLKDEKDKDKISRRRIVVFFLVNPEKRIISTREVMPQQEEAGGTMSRQNAFQHRLALMRERKYTKQDWNVRPIELCEH